MRVAAAIALSKEDRRRLGKWVSARTTAMRLRERARIVLMAATGLRSGTDGGRGSGTRTTYSREHDIDA